MRESCVRTFNGKMSCNAAVAAVIVVSAMEQGYAEFRVNLPEALCRYVKSQAALRAKTSAQITAEALVAFLGEPPAELINAVASEKA